MAAEGQSGSLLFCWCYSVRESRRLQREGWREVARRWQHSKGIWSRLMRKEVPIESAPQMADVEGS